MGLKTLLTSLGLGAGLMYFYDPRLGNRRRAMLRDQVNRSVNRFDDGLNVALEDLRNRTRGSLAELAFRFDNRRAPDWILEERVRARLGRYTSYAGAIQVRADGGRISLSGPVLAAEADTARTIAARTRGVHGVDDRLERVDAAKNIPGLQGMPNLRRPRPEWQQANWSPAMRLVGAAGGGLLAVYGLARGGLMGLGAKVGGALLAARSLTNLDPRSLLGLELGENAIRVNKAINIAAPIDEVYRFWENFENFPLFMNHVKEVHTQNGASYWKVAGPAGATVEFEALTTRREPNEIIAWETAPDAQVRHAGSVRFDENSAGGTRVTVQMRYVPPAGALGHAVASLFGVDPRQSMHADLQRLKTLIEEGRTSTNDTKVYVTGSDRSN